MMTTAKDLIKEWNKLDGEDKALALAGVCDDKILFSAMGYAQGLKCCLEYIDMGSEGRDFVDSEIKLLKKNGLI